MSSNQKIEVLQKENQQILEKQYSSEEIKRNTYAARDRQDREDFDYWFNLWMKPLKDKGIVA